MSGGWGRERERKREKRHVAANSRTQFSQTRKETERGRKKGERTKKGRRERGGGEEKREGERLRDQLIDLGDLRALERGRKEHTQPG